jgi:hypothetical protein
LPECKNAEIRDWKSKENDHATPNPLGRLSR